MKIPPGFNTLNAYMIVHDAPALIEFLVHGLEGKESLRHEQEGRIHHAQVQVGNSTIMLSEASQEYPAMAAAYYMYVADADRAHVQALAAGATEIIAVADMPYGDRHGGVRDPFGNVWWLAQRIVDGGFA
jgi:PhnB protein